MSQKKNRHYPEEFKREALQLLAAGGRSASNIERELAITQGLLSRWQRKAERRGEFQPKEHATTMSLEEQVKQLKRENARLREEKAILKKLSPFSATDPDEICLHRRESLSICGAAYVHDIVSCTEWLLCLAETKDQQTTARRYNFQ